MWWVGHLQEVALLAPVPRSTAWAPDTGSRHLRPQQLAAGVCIYQVPLSSVPSHAVNLLGNLPVKCLDVLLTLEPHEGSLEFLGVNMDVIRVLLSFMEKRLHQVLRWLDGAELQSPALMGLEPFLVLLRATQAGTGRWGEGVARSPRTQGAPSGPDGAKVLRVFP